MSKPYHTLPEALKGIVSQMGDNVIEDIKLVNILDDLYTLDDILSMTKRFRKRFRQKKLCACLYRTAVNLTVVFLFNAAGLWQFIIISEIAFTVLIHRQISYLHVRLFIAPIIILMRNNNDHIPARGYCCEIYSVCGRQLCRS